MAATSDWHSTRTADKVVDCVPKQHLALQYWRKVFDEGPLQTGSKIETVITRPLKSHFKTT